MLHEGKTVTVKMLDNGIVELSFDLQGESVNKFNRETLDDLREDSSEDLEDIFIRLVGASMEEIEAQVRTDEEE